MKNEILLALTPREKEIVELLAKGFSNKQIMNYLGIGRATLDNHVFNCFGKLGVKNRTQLMLVVCGYKATEEINFIAPKNQYQLLKTRVNDLKKRGLQGIEIAKRLGIHRNTVYRYIKEQEFGSEKT